MGKKVKTQVSAGKELEIPFETPAGVITYKAICPVCQGERFVMAIDYSRIACSNPDCLSILFFKLPDVSIESDKVQWKID